MKRVPINPPKVCFACKGSSNGKCTKHDDKKRNPDQKLWEEADGGEHDANSWEVGFLESTRQQIDRGIPLTDKQCAKLEEIRDRDSGAADEG